MVWYITFFCQHEQSFMVVEKIVFWRVRIITFKVRSLVQSRSNETCYYNIYTVWPGFRIVTVFPFFSPLFRKNCSTRFFLSVIFFLSSFLFFLFYAWIYKLLKIGRVYTIVWATTGITHSRILPIGPPSNIDFPSRVWQWFAVTVDLSFDKKLIGRRTAVQTEKGPRVSRSSARKRWLEGMVGETRLPDEFETSLTILVCPEGGRVVSGSIL